MAEACCESASVQGGFSDSWLARCGNRRVRVFSRCGRVGIDTEVMKSTMCMRVLMLIFSHVASGAHKLACECAQHRDDPSFCCSIDTKCGRLSFSANYAAATLSLT